MQTALYYKNSGVVPPLAPILMLTVGAIGTWVLALIYAYATAYIPFIYISFLLTIFFGMGIGMLVNLCGSFGKARNTTFMIGSGVVLALFGLYACWAIWFKANEAGTGFFISPKLMFGLMGLIAEEGAWSIFDYQPTGGALYAVWAIEALLILGGALFLVYANTNDTPFCEECNKWADEEKVIGPLAPIVDPTSFKAQIEQRNLQAILELPLIEDRYIQYTNIKLLSCPDERSTLFLTVLGITIETDDEGKESEDENEIIKNLIITREEYDQLLNHNYVQDLEDTGEGEEIMDEE